MTGTGKSMEAAMRGGIWGSPWLVVIVLLVLYVFSYIDRVIINMMVEPIQRDLQLTDFQISLLQGPAFGVLYVVSGLFMGYLIDRHSKRLITMTGVGIWGSATLASGLTGNFTQLALGRAGVGVGESVLTPAAHSIISEKFPKDRLSTAMAIYTMGAMIGGGIALVVGGSVVQWATTQELPPLPLVGSVAGWQAVFIVVGAATLLLLPTCMLIPRMTKSIRPTGSADAPPLVEAGFVAHVRRHWKLYILLPAGFGCTNILVNAYYAWHPTFMMRTYGLNAAEVGWLLGVQHLVAGVIGQIGSAMIVDWLYRRGVKDAHVKYQIAAILFAIPLMIIGMHSESYWAFIFLSGAFYCFCLPFVAYAGAALQLFTPTHLRARVSALFLAIVNLIGSAIGSPATGWLTDNFYGDKTLLANSLTIVTIVTTPFIVGILWIAAREMRLMHALEQPLSADTGHG